MQLVNRKLPNDHNIFLFGDDHEGTILRYKKGFDKLLNMMNSSYDGLPAENNFGIHHGDILEGIMVTDPRYDMDMIPKRSNRPMEQAKKCIENLKPIKNKLITILEGNHPLLLKNFGLLTKNVCDELGVEYGTWSTKTIVSTARGRLMYKIFSTHGRKSITSTADDPKRRRVNRELILKRHLKFKMGDCVIMSKGHTHQLLVCAPERELIIVDKDGELKSDYTGTGQHEYFVHPDSRWYVNTGSFVRLYGKGVSGYAEVGEYDPIELGFAIAKIRDRRVVDIVKVPIDV